MIELKKNKLGWEPVTKFLTLRKKRYSYLKDNESIGKIEKGTKYL